METRLRDANGTLLEIGDKVRRIDGEFGGMVVGDVGTITEFRDDLHVSLEEYGGGHGVSHFIKDKEENEI
ncbi:hypothetical protein [Romboutsia sp.]|uniref:hypothetical protein n=1 Tax=Romboutsia sp. TaxID=1965302 RepID=UPI002BF94CBD|nr:hypothetical protein [Romboutsia sp.]HSQ90198.1 hypothetical protein [Romboutsia sp.]